MKLQKSRRTQARIRLCLQGPSGSGKTYSALHLAFGLCNDWTKVAVIDTENGSASLYAHLGEYFVLSLAEPFSPEKYLEAMQVCQDAGIEVIIIDSISFEWEFLLDYHGSLTGNSFSNWAKVTPRHNKFVQGILQSSCHIIATARTKQDYVLADKNGKMVPEKVQLKIIQRDGIEYEFTLVFDLDMKNNATASKDRTGLFHGQPERKLNSETGKQILQWCQSAEAIEPPEPISDNEARALINRCTRLQELTKVFNQCNPDQQAKLLPEFKQQKQFILNSPVLINQLLNQTISQNGKSTNYHQG